MNKNKTKSGDNKETCEHCLNCGAEMEADDKYCQYCGTGRGKKSFFPVDNGAYALYGPPITAEYSCKVCGHKWKAVVIGFVIRPKYCPVCRSRRVESDFL